MTVYCANDPCTTEAMWFYVTEDGTPFWLCHTCSEAFSLGTVNPDAQLFPVEDWGLGYCPECDGVVSVAYESGPEGLFLVCLACSTQTIGLPGLGDQIIYIPVHARGNEDHPDVEAGFITSVNAETGTAFCRYWYGNTCVLRTTANSEATPLRLIRLKATRAQELIAFTLKELGYAD